MRKTRGDGLLQKILYLVIILLGAYILYKGAHLLGNSQVVQTALDSGTVQRGLEDAAVRTYAPGYAAAVEEWDRGDWIAGWMQQVAPVYSYLAENSGETDEMGAVGQTDSGMESGEYESGADKTVAADGTAGHAVADGEIMETGETVLAGEMEPSGTVIAGGTEPDGPVIAGETEPSGTVIAGGTEPDGTVIAGETEPNRTVIAGTTEPSGTAIAEEAEAAGGTAAAERTTPGTGGPAAKEETADKMTAGDTLPQETAPDAPVQDRTSSQKEISEEDASQESMDSEPRTEAAREVLGRSVSPELMEQLGDFNYLLGNYFTVDGGTAADAELLDASALLGEDLSLAQDPSVPQILIYHTHSQEAFADSVEGDTSTTIVGMGEVLAEELRSYGYQVIHDTGIYDLVDGVLDRSAAYDYARASVEQILAEHPTIEVIIDLHRDGVDGQKFVTEIDGKPTSMIMFFNGISRNSQDEPLSYLANPYIHQNLAFSFQMELKAREQYPGFTRNIYLKAERFNLHLRPRSLLIEAGTQLNTVEEERNAMIPLANLLHQVLSSRE